MAEEHAEGKALRNAEAESYLKGTVDASEICLDSKHAVISKASTSEMFKEAEKSVVSMVEEEEVTQSDLEKNTLGGLGG